MRSGWSPSVVPAGVHDTVYLVVDYFGRTGGCVWREANITETDLETVIADLMRGEYTDPLCVVAFNTTENWSRDVTADVARELQERYDLAYEDVPAWLEDLVHSHVHPEQRPVAAEAEAMSDISPSIAPEIGAAALGPDALLDLVGHLGAALIQSDKIVDQVVLYHLQPAHQLALELYSSSGGSHRYRNIEA